MNPLEPGSAVHHEGAADDRRPVDEHGAAGDRDAGPVGTRGRTVARLALGGFLVFAGIGHLTFGRQEFQAQVPDWVPLDADAVVLASGVVEVALGTALAVARGRRRVLVGGAAAAFFVAVFPGNVSQLVTRTDAFGLDSDVARATRLVFQPLLVAWALWSTGAWHAWRRYRDADARRS